MALQGLHDMLAAAQPDLEAFLTQVYRAVAGAAPLKDKVRQRPLMHAGSWCCRVCHCP